MQEADIFLEKVVSEFFTPLYQLAVGITIVYFLYGAARFVIDLNSANADRQAAGRRHLLYGMIGLFIVLSVGGILNIIDGIFGGFFN